MKTTTSHDSCSELDIGCVNPAVGSGSAAAYSGPDRVGMGSEKLTQVHLCSYCVSNWCTNPDHSSDMQLTALFDGDG